jgi:hypothetical protein
MKPGARTSRNVLVILLRVASEGIVLLDDLRSLISRLPSADWGSEGEIDVVRTRLLSFEWVEVGSEPVPLSVLLRQVRPPSGAMEAAGWLLAVPRLEQLLHDEPDLDFLADVPVLLPGKRLSRRRDKAVLGAFREALELLKSSPEALPDPEARARARVRLRERVFRSAMFLHYIRLDLVDGDLLAAAWERAELDKLGVEVGLVTNPIGGAHALLLKAELSVGELRAALGLSAVALPIENRTAYREFKPDHPLSHAEVAELLRGAGRPHADGDNEEIGSLRTAAGC